jgi:hypothetical protein
MIKAARGILAIVAIGAILFDCYCNFYKHTPSPPMLRTFIDLCVLWVCVEVVIDERKKRQTKIENPDYDRHS